MRYFKSFFKIFFSLIFVFAVVGYFVYLTNVSIIQKNAKTTAKNILIAKSQEINSKLVSAQNVAMGLAIAIENLIPQNGNEVKSLIKGFMNSTPIAYGSTVSFLQNKFGDYEYFAPYFHREAGELVYSNLADTNYNYTTWDWFKIPLETKKPMWTEPYLDIGGGNIPMVTYAVPFFKNGKVWGVATVDIALSELTKISEEVKIGFTGFAFLISKKGTFLSHQDDDLEMKSSIYTFADKLKNNDIKNLGDEMTAGNTGLKVIVDPKNKLEYLIAYGPIPSTGWSLAIDFPKGELTTELFLTYKNTIYAAGTGILFILIVSLLSIRRKD